MNPRIAIIRFPGTNRHQEAFRTLEAAGMEPEYVLWNADHDRIRSFDGYLIAGGFSYEDRSRAGVIAALDPVMEVLRVEGRAGKPIIGICNGAQILIETGMVPGLTEKDMCIAESVRKQGDTILGTGFINHWTYLKMTAIPKRSAFNYTWSDPSELIHCIVAHGEGRYTTANKEVLTYCQANDQVLFRYSTAKGEVKNEYPINPNGAMDNIAGIINQAGNILAIMPHPEQLPTMAKPLFESMRQYIIDGGSIDLLENLGNQEQSFFEKITPSIHSGGRAGSGSLKNYTLQDTSFLIHKKLVITDKEEQTLNDTIKDLGIDGEVKKYVTYQIDHTEKNHKELFETLLATDTIANLKKETVYFQTSTGIWKVDEDGFHETQNPFCEYTVFVSPHDNFPGMDLLQTIKQYDISEITNVTAGKVFDICGDYAALLKTTILHNSHSQSVIKM